MSGPAEPTSAGNRHRHGGAPVYPVAQTDARSWLLRRRQAARRSPASGTGAQESSGPDGAASVDGLVQPPELEERPMAGTGICLSGGGIRSAAYSLGVLQSLQQHGQLHGPHRADFLAAVSGGSYIAGALSLVALPVASDPSADPPEPRDERALQSFTFEPAAQGAPDGRPFAPGTPEERYLRNHTQYLTHGRGGKVAIIWRCLLGIVLNVGFMALALHAVARPLGWLYGWRRPTLRFSDCGVHGCAPEQAPFGTPRSTVVVLVVIAGFGVLSGLLWVGIRLAGSRKWFARGTAIGMTSAALGVVFFVGLPNLLALLRHQSGGRAGAPTNLRLTAGGGLVALTATAIGAARLAFQRPIARTAATRLKGLIVRLRMPLLNVLAAVLGPFMLAAGFVWFVSLGAAHPVFVARSHTVVELAWWVGLGSLLFIGWRFADIVAWSLHPFYKERLASGFALRRTTVKPPGDHRHRKALRTFLATSVNGVAACERPYDRLDRLSDSHHPELPELLVCAAANVNDYGVTPTGFNATSFVFSSSWIGGPLVGCVETDRYEKAVGKGARDVTVPASEVPLDLVRRCVGRPHGHLHDHRPGSRPGARRARHHDRPAS